MRDYWKRRSGQQDFERFWRKSLHDGVVAGTAAPTKQVSIKQFALASKSGDKSQGQEITQGQAAEKRPNGTLEFLYRPDPTILDGRLPITAGFKKRPSL